MEPYLANMEQMRNPNLAVIFVPNLRKLRNRFQICMFWLLVSFIFNNKGSFDASGSCQYYEFKIFHNTKVS